jgi:23S rRNA pseudouridine1911/1915/1917 synthase
MRLDRFLSIQLRATSRTRAQAIIDASAFSWEGKPLRPSERVRAEQQVVLWRPPFEETPPPHEIQTLYEDEHLLVVDKPPLMTVHPTARHHRQTVIKQLEEKRPGETLHPAPC